MATPRLQSTPSGKKRPCIRASCWRPGRRQGRRPRRRRAAGRTRMASGRDAEAGEPRAVAAQVQRDPDQRAHDRQRQQQMRGQAEVADVGAVGEAGHHHVPAERALQPAEHQQPDHASSRSLSESRASTRTRRAPPANTSPIARPSKRWRTPTNRCCWNWARVIPAGPLISRYSGVCRYSAKARSQSAWESGRDGAADRPPFGDRQTAFGEPGDAADDHHREHQSGDEQQQVRQCPRTGRRIRSVRPERKKRRSPSASAYARAASRGARARIGSMYVVSSRPVVYMTLVMPQLTIPAARLDGSR